MRHSWILTLLLAGATLSTPLVMGAADKHDKRYYDRGGRDYHKWDSHEDRAYRVYLGEQHRDYREFGKTKAAEQQQYFKWRHEHPDDVLFKIEIR